MQLTLQIRSFFAPISEQLYNEKICNKKVNALPSSSASSSVSTRKISSKDSGAKKPELTLSLRLGF